MVSLCFVFCWSWIQSKSQVGLHTIIGSGLLPVVPFGRIIMSMNQLPKYFSYKYLSHTLWLPQSDILLTCSVQWDLIIPGTLRGNRSSITMQDLLNMHTSNGLRADGSLYSLKNVAGRWNSSLHQHFLSILKKYSSDKVEHAWHCSWLSRSVRITPSAECSLSQENQKRWLCFGSMVCIPRNWIHVGNTIQQFNSSFSSELTKQWMSKDNRDMLFDGK